MKLSEDKLRRLIMFNPFPSQLDIINCPKRDIAICAGRRFGKSMLCAYLALRTLLQDKKKIWIVAPTYDLSKKTFNYVIEWIARAFPSMSEGISVRPLPIIKTAWGSTLECKSTENPTGLLGEELDLLIADESSRISRDVFDIYLHPLTASRRGRSIFISTPFGKNKFFEKYMELKDSVEGQSFHFRSLDNPYFPKEEWERAKNNLPEQVFKQEYEAFFLEDAASVFRNVESIVKDYSMRDAVMGERFVIGVDLGKHHDFTVLTVVDADKFELVHFDRFKQIDWAMQKQRIEVAARRYNNARVIIDSTGLGDPIAEDLKLSGLLVDDVKISGKSKTQIIQKLSNFIDLKKIRIPAINVLVDELTSFGYQLTSSGNVRYAAPTGLYDDCVISLALAIWGLAGEPDTQTWIARELKKQQHKVSQTRYD